MNTQHTLPTQTIDVRIKGEKTTVELVTIEDVKSRKLEYVQQLAYGFVLYCKGEQFFVLGKI